MDLDQLVALPALSVRQPWASFIVSGIKSVELRTWPTDYRGWLWIHTGKQVDAEALEIFHLAAADFRTGGLVGIACLEACEAIRTPAQWYSLRNDHRSPGEFAAGTYAWRFADVLALSNPIGCRGELGLFKFEEPVRFSIKSELRDQPQHEEFLVAAASL